MFFTEYGTKNTFIECFDNADPSLFQHIPAGNDVPPPPNPALDMVAAGHRQHAMAGDSPETPASSSNDGDGDDVRQPVMYSGIRNAPQFRLSNMYTRDGGRGGRDGGSRDGGNDDYYYDFGDGDDVTGGRWRNNDFYYQVGNQRNRYRKLDGDRRDPWAVPAAALPRTKYSHGLDSARSMSHDDAQQASSGGSSSDSKRVMTSSVNKHLNEPQLIPVSDRVVNGNRNVHRSGVATNPGAAARGGGSVSKTPWQPGRKCR